MRLLNLVFVFAATTILGSLCAAQTNQVPPDPPYPVTPVPSEPSTMPYPAKPVPQANSLTPFSTNASSSGIAQFIVYRPLEEMSQSDRDLAAKAQPAIRDAAAFAGIEFDKEKWRYRQLDCQALPGHLFLLFAGDSGVGDASLFSAAIPRAGKGRVRVIPVERRGFSLFSPAPVNALAVAAFNRIRAQEPAGPPPDWLSTSLCYAALTEPRSEVSASSRPSPEANLALSFPPTLEVGVDGESTVRFVNVAEPRQPMQWVLTFDPKGQLIKVQHLPTPTYATTIVPTATPQ
ncbi:MAG: hypothetical protein ABSA42_10860 [Terracidiphilus sp.]